MSKHPDIRHELSVAAVGGHHQKYIREGLPEVGWSGDPWLTLAYNRLEDRWEIWLEDPGRDPQKIMQSKPFFEGIPSVHELCAKLAEGDLRKRTTKDVLADIDKHNAKLEADIAQAHRDRQNAALEKVYWHVGKAMGEYKPFWGASS